MKKTHKLKSAWIVRWTHHGSNDNSSLNRYGLDSSVVDVLSGRRNFDNYIVPYAENLYRQKMLSFGEKFYLAHYNYGKRFEEYFKNGRVPRYTHYHSDAYRDLMRLTQEFKSDSEKFKEAREKWISTTPYISIGHNPSIEIRLVHDLSLEDNGENVTLTWKDKQTGQIYNQTQPDLKGVCL